MPTDVATPPMLEALERELWLHRELVAAYGAGIYRLDLAPPIPIDLPIEAQIGRLLSDGRFGAANDAMAAMYGYARGEEMVGCGAGEVLLADDPTTRESFYTFARCGYRYHDVETVEIDRAGRRRIFLNSAVGVLEAGALVAVWGSQRDLTEERQTLERLRQSEQLFRRAFQLNPAGLVLSTLADGRFLDVNAAFTAMVGLPRESLLGRAATDLHLWDSEADRERVVEKIRREGVAQRVPARVRRADGELRLALVSGMTLEIEGERCLLTLSEDVTEQQRTAEALHLAEEDRRRLEREMQDAQRLEALGLLAGGVAHDFNNLLTAIQGYAELARRRLEPASPVVPLLDEILVGARRAGELTQKMLAFAGGTRLEVGWVSLNEIVSEVVELAWVAIPAEVELHLELGHPGPGFEGDATQIRQVAMNLLLNAAEAIDKARGRIRVATGEVYCERARLDRAAAGRERPEGRYAFLTVADDGCGMSESVRARIFDPFYSTKFTGRGLGLAAVLGIVRAHGGAIEVESAAGAGSTFTVLLPLALPVPPAPGR